MPPFLCRALQRFSRRVLAGVASLVSPAHHADHAQRKIARLPHALREQLNQRLLDNQSAPQILPWLNETAALKYPHAINDGNLSEWRCGGFADWLEKQDRVERTKQLAEFSLRIAEAGGGTMNLPAAIAGGQIMEVLEEFDPALLKTVLAEEPEKWIDILGALAKLQKSKADELSAVTTGRQNDVKLAQSADKLALERARFERQTCELFRKWFADERARQILEDKALAPDVQMDQLRALMFGEVTSDAE